MYIVKKLYHQLERILGGAMRKKAGDIQFPINLFCSLMLLGFIPFLYTIVRTNLIADIPSTDGLGIAGQIEWFDLINETVQAFLIVPLYALFNRCMQDRKRFGERIFQAFVVVNAIYIVFAAIIFWRCNGIVSTITSDRIEEVTRYLQLETIGFILANIVSFVNVLFVVLEKPFYIYAMVILRTVFTLIGDLFLIPGFGVNGVAYSNIAVNAICAVLCVVVMLREGLIVVSGRFDLSFFRKFLFIGFFSGSQIFLDNLIYSAVVCKMVNDVAEQGNYWVANNIIWGLMLIPISALAEIIKKDCKDKLTSKRILHYNIVILLTFLVWLCFVPIWNPFLKNVMGIENHETVRQILIVLMPFYFAYGYTVLFDNILIGFGKTYYCFVISAVVDLIYYPIVYRLFLNGIFMPSITFICMMFGFGMVIHLGCSILCFAIDRRHSRQNERGGK